MAANRYEEYKEKKAAEQSSGQQADGQKSETRKKNRYEEYKEKNGESQKHWDDSNVHADIANSVYECVNAWLQDHNTYLSNYNSRYKDRKYSYEDAYVSDSAQWLDTVSRQKSAFDAEADRILAYMDQNAGYLDEDFAKSVRETLTRAREDQGKILESYTKDHDYWNSFAPNEEQKAAGYTADKLYKQWQAEMKQYSEDLAYDVEAGTQELEALKKGKEEYLAGKAAERKKAQSEETFWDSLGRWLGNTPDTSIPLAGVSSASNESDPGEYDFDKRISELETQIDRAKYTQGYEGYMGNMNAQDYAQGSQYASTRTGVAMGDALWGMPGYQQYDTGKLFGDYTYDYINRNQDALDAANVNNTQSGAYFVGVDEGFLQTMTDEEIGVYNYLYKTQSPEAANEFLTFISSDLEGRRRAQENAQWAAYAKESPVGASVFSTLISPLKGLSYLGQAADMLDDGAMDENAGYNRFSEIPSTIRSQVSSTIEKSGKWGEVGSFAYNTGMSMADFLFTTGVSGGNQAISLAIMGTGAAADATIAAKQRGLDDGQAFALGTVAGLAEVAMEKVSLGAWLEGDMTEGALRYMLKNALAEGAEEAGTSAVNLLADILIAGDKSEWNLAMQAYMDAGKSQAEAFGLVAAENAAQIGLDALGGMFSGSAIGGGTYAGTSAVAGVQYGNTGKNKESAQKLVTESLELNPNSQYAQKMQGKVEKGKNLTGMQVRNLLAANREVITENDMKKIQTAAQERLTELGQTGNVEQIAELATRWATGDQLTGAEKRTLAKSTYGSRVANELIPENIKSGEFSTEWAEEIGTEIVNAESYNKKALEAVSAAIELITTEQKAAEEANTEYKPLEERVGTEGRFNVAESGEAVVRESGEKVDLENFEVTKLEDGEMTIKPEGGEEVYAGDIDFATSEQSHAFSGVADMEGMTPAAATEMLKVIDYEKPVGEQLNGLDEAFTYGRSGYSEADLKAGDFVGALSDAQMMKAYNLGKELRKSNAEKNAPVVKMRTAAEAKVTEKQKTAKQKARFQGGAEVYFMDRKTKTVKKFDEAGTEYDETRMAGVNAAKFLSRLGIGKKYYFYESYVKDSKRYYVDENGVEKPAPNGIYKVGTGTFYIDLNAGDKGQGVTLFTLAHELTHFVKDQSESQFQRLADIVKEAYDKTDLSLHERTVRRQNEMAANREGKHVSYDDAYEEVICDALSTMMADGSFYEQLAEIKVKDRKLFDSIKKFFQKIISRFQDIYDKLTPDQQDARDIREMKDVFDKLQRAFAEALVEAGDNFQAAMESVVEAKAAPVSADEIITDGAVVTDGEGEKHSIRSMKQDIAEGKMFEDLKTYCGWTQKQVDTLRNQLKDLVEYMIPYRDILDMNESYGREGRRFSPYKPNSDPLYKISMDFSTLCSKRLLTQYVIENLQLRENRPMSAEEQMAIRDMLNEYRKVEKGLQVACAMCYVEAARLKSPKQIQRWLDDPAPHLTNYFAMKNTESNESVKKAQADFKESRGYDRNAPKKDMKPADVRELNKIGPKLRSQYQLSAQEQAIVEKAKTLPNSTYLTAGNLANLSETDPAIYDAYTAFVRTATRSKSLETDEPYYYGDSRRDNGNGIIVSDSFIEAVNRENGMRFSSWSDWRIQHMLDYITAVIDNSVRGAAMHGYTKFGDEVRVLGKTGMMFNMSGVTGTQTGLNEDGSLNFSDTESIDVNEAIQLREEFPETAGLQCIGVSNEHITALLRSDIIDYVIPYHVSGLNAALRRMADIHGWKDYTGTQHAAIDKSIKLENAVDKEHWHEEPVYSEFFVGYDTGMTGIEAMRASAEKYKQLCRDRGLTPKFNQFAQEENYWKLLIDRKMVNQKTGKLIQQKAVTPAFDFDVIKSVVDKFVDNYDAGLEQRALNHIVENWDSIPNRIKELKKGKAKKAADTLANQTVAAQAKGYEAQKNTAEDGGDAKYSDRYLAADTNSEILSMVNRVSNGEFKANEKVFLGVVSDAIADQIYALTGIKVNGFRIAIEARQIDHILKDHGTDGASDHSMADPGDIARMEYTLSEPDNISKAGKTQAYTYMRDGRNRTADTVLYEKNIGTKSYYVVQAVPDTKAKTLFIVTAFIGNSGYKKEASQLTNAKSPGATPKVGSASTSAVNVAQDAEEVNKNSERTGDSVSNRSLLANAFEGITQNSEEYKLIQEYKGRIKILNEYEEKLSDLNAEIRKLTFGTEGGRDSKKLKELQEKAKEIAGHINRNDKKLLNLEASEPLRRVVERERKKEAQKTKEHVAEIQQNRKLRAEQTELRHKIRKVIRDLDKILNRGNKKLNVKEDVQKVVTKALQAADILFTDNYGNYDMLRNGIHTELSDAEEALVKTCARMLKDLDKMPTDGYDNFQARQEAENRLKAKMAGLKEVFARERKRLNSTTVSSILGDLAEAYASLEKSEQSYVQGAYSEAVYNFLKSLQSEVGGTIVRDMTKNQLESLYAAYKMVLTTVRRANQMFNEELKQSREQLGNAVIQEVMSAGGTHGLWTKGEIARSQADWNNTKPVWVANRIGSDTFGKLMNGLFKGQYNFAVDIDEAKKFKLEMDKKYHPRSWDAEKQYPFRTPTGKEFSLNLQQIMSLYAYSKREQAYSHLLNGGFAFDSNSTVIVDEKGIKRTYLRDGATAYKLNEATLNEILRTLTKEQQAYVDEMQKYLSEVMGEKGNEVSMQLYGIRMFNEKFYFPLRSSGAYLERAKEAELKKQQGQINIVNSGFTHAVKPEAKNPVILAGFADVWAEHCNEMSMYHAMVLPMEDFRKVYNYSTIHDDKMDSASVYQTIQDAYGKAATGYIDQLYRDLNAGATIDPRETPFKAFISKFKKAAVMLSGSVWVQQYSSIGRAYAIIDPKYFTGAKVNSGTQLSAAEEMKKYAPVAIIKEMGGFDTGTKGSAKSYILAEQYGKGELIQGIKTDEQYRSDLMGYLPAKADEKTWCAIWEAAKRETRAKHPKMDVQSEEFLKLAAERFSETIEKTQVYDSVLARSANMRSKSAFMQMATAFMAEPTTTINLLEDAIRGKDKKQMARAFGAVAVSIVLNNALASIVYAMRDDDEDETFLEKYFQSFASGMVDDINPMSYYPFLKDVYSLFQGYDVERADMSVIADVRDALKKSFSVIGKDTSNMDDKELAEHHKNVYGVLMSLLDAGCSMFGVPIKNVRRDANGIINAWKTVKKDVTERDTTWDSFWDKVGAAVKDTIPIFAWAKDRAKGDKLYDAIVSGDTAYLDRLKAGYKDEAAYNSAVRKALRESDPRIREAAQAKYDGNSQEYKRIFRQIQGEGKFGFDEIMDAINTELSNIKKGINPAKESSNYSATDFVNAVIVGEAGTAAAMREEILAHKVAGGDTMEEAEKSFAGSVATSVRNAFDAGLLDAAGAENMLVEYAGKDAEEAAAKVSYWTFCKANPGYDLSEANVEDYHEFAEPAEIPLEVFAEYVEGTKGLVTIRDEWGDVEQSVRDQTLAVIDSLPLTWQQKDALYLAAGYAESKMWDVPW